MFLDRSTDGFVNIEALLSPHLWYNKISRLFIFVVCVFYVFALNLYCICIFLRSIDGWFCQSWGTVLHPRCVEKSNSFAVLYFHCICVVILIVFVFQSYCICVIIFIVLLSYFNCICIPFLHSAAWKNEIPFATVKIFLFQN